MTASSSAKRKQQMKTNPLVSIIIPVYNTAKYLSNCLNSIINQSYCNLEIIIIDDGSTDDSYKIAKKYASKDSRIKLVHQKNSGQSTARNHGIKLATGKYISFIDSDDLITKDFIEKLLKPFGAKDTILSVCGIHYKRLRQASASDVYTAPIRNRHKSESRKAYILYLLAIDGRMYSSVNKLYKANIIKSLSFDKNLNFAEDTKFVLDYLDQTQGKISFILEPLYIYNYGTETSTMSSTATVWQNWQTAYDNLKTWLGPSPTAKEKFWLHLVRLRWRISCVRSKRRAKR